MGNVEKYKKDFSELIYSLGQRHDRINVFKDFLELSSCVISNKFDPSHADKRNASVLDIHKKYSDEELNKLYDAFSQFAELIQENFEHGEFIEILGRLYQELGFSDKGQDFTPNDLAELITRIVFMSENEELLKIIDEKGYITLNECTCGSGGLILPAVQYLHSRDVNYCSCFAVLATELSRTCALMTYLQLSFYAIPAVVIWGNTITLEEYERWYTPAYILNKWVWKNPLNLTAGRSIEDEKLKIMTDPFYAACRNAYMLLKE